MIKRQNKEVQYLKLLGMTLVVTAVCVSDSGRKDDHALSMVDNAQVREIILGHIQQYSVQQYHDVIDWELALKEVPSVNVNYHSCGLITSDVAGIITVDQVSKSKIKQLYSLLEEPILLHPVLEGNPSNYLCNSVCCLDSYCKLSNPSRAGPSSCIV